MSLGTSDLSDNIAGRLTQCHYRELPLKSLDKSRFTSLFISFHLFIYTYLVRAPVHIIGLCVEVREQLPPLGPGFKLRLLILAVSSLAPWAISLAPSEVLEVTSSRTLFFP